jgi:hypothetical protein
MNSFEGGTVYSIYNTPDGDPTSAIYSQVEGNRHLFYTEADGEEIYINKNALVDSEDLLKEDESKFYIIKQKKKQIVVTTPPRRGKTRRRRRKGRKTKSVRIY